MTQSTEQERAEFTDGAWYWVEKEGWHDEPPKIAPAMYRADCDAWYSWEFSGISTEYLKVLEPCVHEQAARRAQAVAVNWRDLAAKVMDALADAQEATNKQYPEHVKCYPNWETAALHLRWHAEMFRTGKPIGNGAGNPSVLAALAAAPQPPEAAPVQLPEPVAYVHVPSLAWNGEVRPVVSFEKYEDDHKDGVYSLRTPLYTEQQVRQLLSNNTKPRTHGA